MVSSKAYKNAKRVKLHEQTGRRGRKLCQQRRATKSAAARKGGSIQTPSLFRSVPASSRRKPDYQAVPVQSRFSHPQARVQIRVSRPRRCRSLFTSLSYRHLRRAQGQRSNDHSLSTIIPTYYRHRETEEIVSTRRRVWQECAQQSGNNARKSWDDPRPVYDDELSGEFELCLVITSEF